MELVKVNPEEYGLESTKAKEISNMFKPMLDKMEDLETEYNKVIKLERTPENCLVAKSLRLKYVKIRTSTAEIHKELKQFYLQGGRFVDGWKNAQLAASQGIEDHLSDFENHFINIEKERVEKLQEERAAELAKYSDSPITSLGTMDEGTWNNLITGAKANWQAVKDAEAAAEKERIKQQEEKDAEDKRIREENEKLRKKNERQAAELKKRKDLEEQQKQEASEKEEAELNKGDEEKVVDLINDLVGIKTKYSFKSKKNKKMYSDVHTLIDKIITHIKP